MVPLQPCGETPLPQQLTRALPQAPAAAVRRALARAAKRRRYGPMGAERETGRAVGPARSALIVIRISIRISIMITVIVINISILAMAIARTMSKFLSRKWYLRAFENPQRIVNHPRGGCLPTNLRRLVLTRARTLSRKEDHRLGTAGALAPAEGRS